MNKMTFFMIPLLLTSSAWAQNASADLRSAVQNPISSLISLPFKFTFDYGANNGDGTIMNLNPVVPVTVGEWNLVNRALIPVGRVDGAITGPDNPSPSGSGSASGLGDINYSLYFSPVKYDKVIWGLGPSLNMPTANEDQLGSGKWSAGITGVALTQPDWGSIGILGRQLWSFAGDSDRNDVSQLLVEPFVNYNLDDGWFLISDIIMTANWEADSGNRWTIPLGGGAGRVFKIGNQAINSRLEAYYNVERPEGAPDYSIYFTWQFLFPKK
ncbi:MAG: neuromedin U [Arenicellales bacterium]